MIAAFFLSIVAASSFLYAVPGHTYEAKPVQPSEVAAQAMYDRFIREQVDDPFNPVISYNLGAASFQKKSYEKAQDHFEHALDMGLDDNERLQIRTHFNAGQSALWRVKESLELTKNNPEGEELEKDITLLGDAIEHYDAVLMMHPENERAKRYKDIAEKLKAVLEKMRKEQKEEEKKKEEQKQQQQKQQQEKQSQEENGDKKQQQDQKQGGENGSPQSSKDTPQKGGKQNEQQQGSDQQQERQQDSQGVGDNTQDSSDKKEQEGKEDERSDTKDESSEQRGDEQPSSMQDEQDKDEQASAGSSAEKEDDNAQEEHGMQGNEEEQGEDNASHSGDDAQEESEQDQRDDTEQVAAAAQHGDDEQKGDASSQKKGSGKPLVLSMRRAEVLLDRLQSQESDLQKQQLKQKSARQRSEYRRYNQW